MAISMLKIRRPLGRLIFNMGIAIPGKTVFLIEMAPWTYSGAEFHQHCHHFKTGGCDLVKHWRTAIFHSLWPNELANIGSGNGLLPDGTKPLHEPIAQC